VTFIILLLHEFIEFDIGDSERVILSVTTFFMWFKLLYFLRIFRETGYLIRMISEVLKDMRHFMLVIVITIAAFGDSFLRIAYGYPYDDDPNLNQRFTTGFLDSMLYSYRMILGDFDVSAYNDIAP
jgi:hypothetical protein